jgi:hypothetical protein
MGNLLDIKLEAIGCVMHLRSREAQMRFRQEFTPIAEKLDMDDVGYFYDPECPDRYLTVPGQMVGAMNNGWLGEYQFGMAMGKAVKCLNKLDDDYSKKIYAITDYASQKDAYYFGKALSERKDIEIVFIGIGHKWHQSLKEIAEANNVVFRSEMIEPA